MFGFAIRRNFELWMLENWKGGGFGKWMTSLLWEWDACEQYKSIESFRFRVS